MTLSLETPIRAFLAVLHRDDHAPGARPALDRAAPHRRVASDDGRFELGLWLRGQPEGGTPAPADLSGNVALGNAAEWDVSRGEASMGNATALHWDAPGRRLRVLTSVVGLPPVFVHDTPARLVVTSDLALLRDVPDLPLAFDTAAVADLCRIGYPIGYRTLFEGVRLVAGGTRLDANPRTGLTTTTAWSLPEAAPLGDRDAYTDLQVELFREAMRRIDIDGSFLSLTAGLDTRTILAALVAEKRTLPACTMSWRDVSLDARSAAALCRAYGLPHEVVAFDEGYARDVERHALLASRLSGGLSGLGQATEIAFYERVGHRFRGRLSGFLGNQVGRRGVEQVSLRNADRALLGAPFRAAAPPPADPHWYYGTGERTGPALDTRFVLREALFACLGNFALGHHFVTQASPYASRRLIEALSRAPRDSEGGGDWTPGRMKKRDLRHRFLGEDAHTSFQRKLVAATGGFVARHPINWGWRAAGGVAPLGLVRGLLTAADGFVDAGGRDGGVLPRLFETLRITGRHDFKQPRRWYTREFVTDTLRARAAREDGLLDGAAVDRALDEHYGQGQDRLGPLTLALDLVLAHRVFIRRG